jgi:DNA anti-recombination protein RmuC
MTIAADAMAQSLAAAKDNQTVLNASMAQYETALKDITSQMGDALGKIIKYHLKSTNDQIAESINENLRLTRAANMEHISEIKGVFAELAEQSRYQTRILMDLLSGASDARAHSVRPIKEGNDE